MNGPSYSEIHAGDTALASNFYAELFGWKFDKDENTPVDSKWKT